jgi:lipoprotein-releasing system permease protein
MLLEIVGISLAVILLVLALVELFNRNAIFEWSVALRHLMSRERRRLVSIITVISILGVLVGVMALVVVISVMDGAQEDYLAKLIDQFSHLEIWESDPAWGTVRPLENWREVCEIIETDPDVIATSPVLRFFSMLKRDARFDNSRSFRPSQIYGIVPEMEARVSRLLPQEYEKSAEGSESEGALGPMGGLLDVKNVPPIRGKRSPGEREVVLGHLLARQMGLDLGDDIYALTGQVAHTAMGIVPKQSKLRVAGIFRSGLFQADEMIAYCSLETAQEINLQEGTVDFIHARVTDRYKADSIKERVREELTKKTRRSYIVRSWSELNPEFFQALWLEKIAMFIILLLVVVVAGLNIISTLILVTMEKTRQIGILRAMGCPRRSIARIFMKQGFLIGAVGTILGVLGGLFLCWFIKTQLLDFTRDIIPEAIYGLEGLPVLVKPMTVFLIMISSMSISLLASIIPAWQAARLDIVEALRYD